MLRRISISHFRNVESADVAVDAPEVFLIGENGQGKTNFLEAVYVSCYASTFRPCRDADLIRQGSDSFLLRGEFSSNDELWGGSVSVSVDRDKKEVRLDGKPVHDRGEMVRMHPCVIFSHSDMDYSHGPPERKRWFFDQTASMASPSYLDHLRDYRRVLKMRNASLRGGDRALLSALNAQLARYGLALMEARRVAVEAFGPLFSETYSLVSRLPYEVKVEYRPSWKAKTVEEAVGKLEEKQDMDIENGITLSGPHRDRYAFQAEGRDFSASASTGQLRLLSLCLRSCQAKYCSLISGRDPILLFDDVLLELDPEKRRRFMENLPAYDQAFFTFLPGEPYTSYQKEGTRLFSVVEGRYLPVEKGVCP